MRVSVVIPALNEAEGIRAAVGAAWEAGADEVIVVDGGSQDGTLVLARDCRCLALTAPRGRAAQQNAGAHRAAGDALLFLHADNRLAPGAAGQVRDALADPRVVGGAFRQQIDAAGRLYRWLEWGNDRRARRGRPYGDQGIFVRREDFDACGGFPEVALMEDVLLAGRLRRRGRLCLLPGPIHVSARRWRRHGVVRQTLRNWLLLAALRLGVPPDRLARFYAPHS